MTEQEEFEFRLRFEREQAAVDPTKGMSTGDRLLSGIGSGMSSAVRALGGGEILSRYGLPGTREEANRLDKPLEATTAGRIGQGVGMAASALPTILVPGANTYAGATALGALSGAALTEGDAGDRAKGAAFGAVGGAGGKLAGDAIGAGARWLTDKGAAQLAAQKAANAQKDAAAVAAQNAGYVIPPADVKGGFWNEALNGLSGKIKTAQTASSRNQGVTDELARKAVGLSAGDTLDDAAFQTIRNNAAQVGYAPVRSSGTVTADKTFTNALDNIASTSQGAARSFPGLKDNGIADLVTTLKQAKFDAGDAVDATRVLRDMADKAYRGGDKALGKAYKGAADAIEEQLDRHLQAQGMPDALAAFREARQLIAKTYSVQGATNQQTGNVSAQALAKALEKGKPLSGELRTIAETGQAFPRATQALKEAPKAVSPLDWAMGAMTGTATGDPLGLGTMVVRPAARSLILSQPYQSRMMQPSYAPGLLARTLLPAADSEAFRRGMIPVGIGTGLLSAQP